MALNIQAVRGMNDILPEATPRWARFEEAARGVFAQYGYREIRMPVVEPTALFVRGVGEHTDIVEKEMYTFVDALNGESLSLRPEGTAGCVRAVLEHNLLYPGPQRLWYSGPMFRHERPQKGRYRQFHQFGLEAFGYPGPDIDAEQIILSARLWRALSIPMPALHINSLGSGAERAQHREELIRYLEAHREFLDEDARRRLHTNPLRVLDSKNPAMQNLIASAPKLLDHLGEASRAHFDGLRRHLDRAGVAYEINPRLVRGLDYYNFTVFEWVSDRLGSQGTICGGGRYDGLVEIFGGKPAPGCGFGIGVERVILLLEESEPAVASAPDAYLVFAGEAAGECAPRLAEQLRDAGWRIAQHCGGGGFKTQMKKADASGAAFALLVGDDEAQAGTITVKPLRGGEQETLALDALLRRYQPKH
jgi:histidyl-tRNA synthetase